jgi:hypothetical protein
LGYISGDFSNKISGHSVWGLGGLVKFSFPFGLYQLSSNQVQEKVQLLQLPQIVVGDEKREKAREKMPHPSPFSTASSNLK